MTTLLRNVSDAVGAMAKMVERCAAVGVLLIASWDDDEPGAYDPLLSD